VILCGVLISFATGIFENESEASIIGFRHYGYPLVWRVTKTFQPTEFFLSSLVLDLVFWIAVSFLVGIILEKFLLPRWRLDFNPLLLPLALLIPLGLFMDFMHELGHVLFGVAAGGSLSYMQIAFFELYPQIAVVSQFRLGYVVIEGLSSGFQYGLFLLGGSLTTNIVSWILVLLLVKTNLEEKTKIAVRILGLFGLLDLPLYVFLPQMGLRHWIFIGGVTPEPLLGAERIGIPEPVFYAAVATSTVGLILLYFSSLRERIVKIMSALMEYG